MTLKIRKIGQLKNSGRIKLRFISSISGTRLKSLILRIFMLWQGFFFRKLCDLQLRFRTSQDQKCILLIYKGPSFKLFSHRISKFWISPLTDRLTNLNI